MKEQGIRQCVKCKARVVRADGCFRVTCSNCNTSMCFKCEPDKMIGYGSVVECYKHLTQAHGGPH